MNQVSSVMSTIEWLNNAIADDQSPNPNETPLTPTTSTSNGSLQIIDDPNPLPVNAPVQPRANGRSVDGLIDINDINFDLNTSWKIRGVVSFKYDIRRFSNEHGDGEIFVFDFKDRTGEISVTSFNICATSIEPRIEKNSSYEITNLCIRTTNDTYKTLPNHMQLTTTNKTTITEIMPLDVLPIPYAFTQLDDLETIQINSVIDVQCRVLRDYGLISGITNERRWSKKEIHIMEGNTQCRLTLWNQHARMSNGSLARTKLKCKYLKVKWYNGSKCLQSMDNSLITIDESI